MALDVGSSGIKSPCWKILFISIVLFAIWEKEVTIVVGCEGFYR
jgi:hypothetical protein